MRRPPTGLRLAVALVAVAATAAGACRQLAAQSLAERAVVNLFRDSLRAVSDERALLRLHQRMVGIRPDRVLDRLRLGFVQLRLAELDTDRIHLVDADNTFGSVTRHRPNWPLAWEGRGLARLNLADDQRKPHTIIHLFTGDYGAEAASDIAKSATVDPTFAEGLIKLADIALLYRHAGRIRAAQLAFDQVAGQPVMADRGARLARARLERMTRFADTASALLAGMRATQPDDPVLLLEAGHVTMMQGDTDGPALWLRGLALSDFTAAALYRSDLAQLFPDSTLRQFDATTGAARVAVVERELLGADSTHLRTARDRLLEHYRRLDRARELFTLPFTGYRADDVVAYTPDGHDMDERGLVWVLHGVPDDRTRLTVAGVAPNESWRYTRPGGGEFLFHFVRTDDAAGYRRVASLMDILATSPAARMAGLSDPAALTAKGEPIETRGAGWAEQTAQDLLYSRESTSGVYSQMLSHGGAGVAGLQAAERATGDSSIAHGETFDLHYELPLDAKSDAVALGGGVNGGAVQVAFAISGASLYAPPASGPVVYPVRMRVRVLRGGTVIAAVDTLRKFVASHPISVAGVLVGRLAVPVRPGTYQVYVALETPSRGVVRPMQTVRVPAADSGSIQLSDIALGARSVPIPVSTSTGDTAWLNPRREFRAHEPMQLYFDVDGARPGTPYTVALEILRPGDPRPKTRLAFAATAAGTRDAVHRELDIGQLDTGDYVLKVTVTGPSGAGIVRSRGFTVIK